MNHYFNNKLFHVINYMFGKLPKRIQSLLSEKFLREQLKINSLNRTPFAIFAFDHIGFEVNLNGYYEKKELNGLRDFLISEGVIGVALDIGANVGNHSIHFATYFEKVYSFEPNSLTYQLLKFNVQFFNNIQVFNFGLSDKNENVIAYSPNWNRGSTSIHFQATEKYDLSLKKFDQISDIIFDKIDFIKIDVEGHELSVLKGMENMLRRDFPIIGFEYLNSEFIKDQDLIIQYLNGLGYNLYLDSSNNFIPIDNWANEYSLVIAKKNT